MADARRSAVDRRQRILSRREIEGLIAEGRHIVIYDGKVLKTDAWLQYHPGGQISIKHMVGRDATDEINVYARPFLLEPYAFG
jgi:delta8-fatty-acid desaturase